MFFILMTKETNFYLSSSFGDKEWFFESSRYYELSYYEQNTYSYMNANPCYYSAVII